MNYRTSLTTMVFLCTIIFTTSRPFAQTPFWQQTNGPTGGGLDLITLHPSGLLLAANRSSGIFGSSDQGENWQMLSAGLPAGVLSLTTDTTGCIYAGIRFGGIYRSCDMGQNWTHIVDDSLKDVSVSAIGVNSFQHIFAAGGHRGLFRSTDFGASWLKVITGLTADRIEEVVVGLDERIIVAGTGRFRLPENSGIFLSEDNGNNWSLQVDSVEVYNFALHPDGDVLAASSSGVLHSDNGGESWRPVADERLKRYIRAVKVDAAGRFFAVFHDTIFVSTDKAESWTALPEMPRTTRIVDMVSSKEFELFAATANGAFHSQDKGASWQPINQGLVNTKVTALATNWEGRVFAAVWPGIHISDDDGDSWSFLKNSASIIFPSSIVVAGDGDIFVGTAGPADAGNGIFRSRDGGVTWTQHFGGYILSFGIDQDDVLFATKLFSGFYRSEDDGDSWTLLELPVPGLPDFVASTASFVFIPGVARSMDKGDTWSVLNSPETVLQLSTNSADELFGATNKGIIRSRNNGDTWDAFNLQEYLGLAQFEYRVYSHKPGEIFATSSNHLVYSNDAGITWQNVDSGLINKGVSSFTAVQDRVFVATLGNGVFRSSPLTTSVAAQTTIGPQSLALGQNYPNPFNAGTTIAFELERSSEVELRLFNLSGQLVRVLANGSYGAGHHRINWDGKGAHGRSLSSGIYIYQLSGGNLKKSKKLILMK